MKCLILGSLSVLFLSATAAQVFASSTSPTVGNTTVDVLLKEQQQPVQIENNSVFFTPVRKGADELLLQQAAKTGTAATTNSVLPNTSPTSKVQRR